MSEVLKEFPKMRVCHVPRPCYQVSTEGCQNLPSSQLPEQDSLHVLPNVNAPAHSSNGLSQSQHPMLPSLAKVHADSVVPTADNVADTSFPSSQLPEQNSKHVLPNVNAPTHSCSRLSRSHDPMPASLAKMHADSVVLTAYSFADTS